MKHIRTGKDVHVATRVVAVFLMMTMEGFRTLFHNVDGHLEFSGNNYWALWPRDGNSSLWFNSISRMEATYNLIVRDGNKSLFANKDRRHLLCNIM